MNNLEKINPWLGPEAPRRRLYSTRGSHWLSSTLLFVQAPEEIYRTRRYSHGVQWLSPFNDRKSSMRISSFFRGGYSVRAQLCLSISQNTLFCAIVTTFSSR